MQQEPEFRVPRCVSGDFLVKSSDATSWHSLLHLLHQFGPFCTEFSAVAKRSQMHPNITKHTETWVYSPMVWIWHVRSDKFRRDIVIRTFALIYCSNKTVPNAPKPSIWNKTWVYGPMVSFSCVRSEKFRRDFVARTFALIAPIRPILHRV